MTLRRRSPQSRIWGRWRRLGRGLGDIGSRPRQMLMGIILLRSTMVAPKTYNFNALL